MNTLVLPKNDGCKGVITLPGSKSISNRILLLSALCGAPVMIKNLLDSDDTARMKEALIQLGVKVIDLGNNQYSICGQQGEFKNKEGDFFLGNAGTAFRSLTAALALNQGHYLLKGVERMHERPIKDLVDALNALGLSIKYLENEGFPPLEISPAMIKNNQISVKGSVSSQYLTGLLLSLPMIDQKVVINIDGELISKPYVDITLNLLSRFGIIIENKEYRQFIVPKESKYQPLKEIYVEGDASSASYFLAAGAIAGTITVKGVGAESIQGDVKFADALEQMGALVKWDTHSITVSKPEHGKLKGIDIDCNHIPDAAMTLAIVALFADGKTTLRNIASWRVKETDRIHAMATELAKLGAKVSEGEDYLVIEPAEKLNENSSIQTYDDHRIAMCFSLCSFKVPITIEDPQCVNKTFPNYFAEFNSITDVK